MEFLKWLGERAYENGWRIELCYSSIVDWDFTIGYKATHLNHGQTLVNIQDCDLSYVLAKAEVFIKDWLSENKGGY